ncbi:MAG: methionine adenosyltransferase [Bacilli bacterium]|nr:methionine adenosyltransferase [Bacilli bacterium]
MNYLFTSESVTEGHPDKICDKISDKILDSALAIDKNSKMAVEATIKDNFILIYGEANTKANLDYASIAKNVLKEIGYLEEFTVLVKVGSQSKEIHKAVENSKLCAGDQGIMFGYACDETKELMPLSLSLANKLAFRLSEIRRNREVSWLLPDGKTQVTIEYENGTPKRVDTVVIACQHNASVLFSELRDKVIELVIKPTISSNLIDERTKFLINTSGSFVVGGPFADSGTTGRKIVCDTYGGVGHIGGGCFSSKDPSKVDRSAAYYARYVAKNIVHYGLAKRCEIQVSYAIGMQKPISIYIDVFGTNKVSLDKIYTFVYENFDFSVSNVVNELDLLRPIYYETAAYGHFGKEEYSWEKIKEINISKFDF